ncbi:MAG: M18 family aminopeptidase, partial [Lachnospiraceae bacterium]|nr:M18 family aminopeptidase [Lachnospiraceae bacterium]
WLDRPLGVAGKVSLKGEDIFKPVTRIIDFARPLVTIPNLAIHLNKDMNKGVELNKQTDMAPIIGILNDTLNKDSFFIDTLTSHLQVAKEDILDFDLYLYPTETGTTLGIDNEFISSPRLDNLTSVYSCLYAITDAFCPVDCRREISNRINLIALSDNEEIGSRSKQGADSMIANIITNKIYKCLGFEDTVMYDSIMDGILVSADVSHAFHPNHENKNDPSMICELTKGIVLKFNSSQKYASDTEALAIAVGLCEAYNIPYQKFANRSDTTGGGTLGSIASKWLPMKTIDLGVPLLAMHSARELMGAEDQKALNRFIHDFFY